MKIRYIPFSERIDTGQLVKELSFAETMIRTYFTMSLRYQDSYYKERSQGSTIYFMNYPEVSLLFYFAAGMRSYRINGFKIDGSERKKAWIYMLPLIQSLRAYDFGKKEGTRQLEDDFLDHMLDLEELISDELVPFNYVLSSLPAKCFPQCSNVRLVNGYSDIKVEKNYYLITKNEMRQVELQEDTYNKLSEIFLVPPGVMHKRWMFEYYTGIMETPGKNKERRRVIHRTAQLPDASGCCTYGELSKEVMTLLEENGN